MEKFPPLEEFRELIQLARREDLRNDDVTSRLLIDENAVGVGTLLQKAVGIVCGLPIVEHVCRAYDERLQGRADPGISLRDHRGPIQRRERDAAACGSAGRCGRSCRPSASC